MMRNNIRRIFSLLIAFVLIAGIGLMPAQAAGVETDYKTRDDFYWGINHHHSGYPSYPEEFLEERIHLIAKSGATMIRINGYLETDMTLLDYEVGLCNKYGLKIIMETLYNYLTMVKRDNYNIAYLTQIPAILISYKKLLRDNY